MKGFGNLMDIAQAKELQKLEAAQREQQKLYAMNEKRSVELKYGHCEKYSTFKDPIRKEIEDLYVNLGKRLNESLDTVNGIKKETIVKVWDLSKVELDSIVNASKAHKNQVEVYQAKIMNCANVSQADPIYAQLQVYHQQEMAKLQATANSFIQKCVSKANELILPGQVEQLQLNNPIMNPGANDDLLQKIQELQEKLAQKDSIINSLSQGMQIAYSAVTQVQTQLQEKDAIIAEKNNVIIEKDGVIQEKNIALVEKDTHIQSLTDVNLELTDRVEHIKTNFDTLKTYFIDLETTHQEDHPEYQNVDLTGLVIE
jgi:hypothetical protein